MAKSLLALEARKLRKKGISVGKWDEVSGMKVNKNIPQNTPIFFSDIGL